MSKMNRLLLHIAPFLMMGSMSGNGIGGSPDNKKVKLSRSSNNKELGLNSSLTDQRRIYGGRGLKLWKLEDGSEVWALNLKNAWRKGEKKLGVISMPRLIYSAH